MGWEELKDQGTVAKLLQNSLAQKRVAHAYLFLGPDSDSQEKAAILLAQAVNCDTEVPCGQCRSCRLISARRHPDVELLEPEGRFLRLDQIRDLCRRAASTALVGRTKVYIIQKAEQLLPEAANHLLKTLEEPPAGTMFILCARHRQSLLPTIVSRCQEVFFQPLPPETIAAQLRAAGCTPDQAHLTAQLVAGDWAAAQTWLEDGALEKQNDFVQLVEKLPRGKDAPFLIAEVFAEAPERFLPLLAAWYRDLLASHSAEEPDFFHRGCQDKIAAMAAQYRRQQLLECNKAIERTSQLIWGRINVNVRLTLEALLVQLIPER